MKSNGPIALCLLLGLWGLSAQAETVYVTGQWQFGLHADKSSGSPILRLVPSGTALERIKSEDESSFVRTPDGVDGWIHNSYLVTVPPDVPAPAADGATPDADTGTLEQQLKSERVKTGELQVQIAELRKRLGQDGSNDSLYQKIDQLAMEKKQLEIQLAQVIETGTDPAGPGVSDIPTDPGLYTPRNMMIAVGVALVAGVVAGLYLMDYQVRRRHGGFRI